MPVYEYACPQCEYRFEALIHDVEQRDRQNCPQCGRQKVHRLVSVFAAHQAEASTAPPSFASGGGCQRCGDPNGPCQDD